MARKRWQLWSFILKHVARSQGFLDPTVVLSNLQRFSKPSDVWVPTELLRSGAVLQARGLMNSQAIQHNMDWVWPYWVERQFDPKDDAFIPRAFNVTHINLTHRNWTAIGLPDFGEFPIVDPRGLVTPHFDGWSIDVWILKENKNHLIPSKLLNVRQDLLLKDRLAVSTFCEHEDSHLLSRAEMVVREGRPVCQLSIEASAGAHAWLAISIRPYNPEGVSFVYTISSLKDKNGWLINNKQEVILDQKPDRICFSDYASGDVFARFLETDEDSKEAACEVGMATAAALYEIKPQLKNKFTVHIPIPSHEKKEPFLEGKWKESLQGACRLEIPDKHFQFLYDAALSTLILHSPGDVYPGPYTYKRFWFRDAAFILNAMLCAGLTSRAERALDLFPSRQTPLGHFLSQDGEWDSNGQALWIFDRFCRVTHQKPKPAWMGVIRRAAQWINRKRVKTDKDSSHAGLMPAGFSAEHLGPNDFYYWDDFWSAAGLRAAASLLEETGEKKIAEEFKNEADDLMQSVEKSLEKLPKRLERDLIPTSPYRRMDAGAIGSITVSYPLQLWDASDKRLMGTIDFLLKKCFLKDGFYQEISHSGINVYLTLHVAQVLLRAGDRRFLKLVNAMASLATTTGQWPEAIHPRTGGGCMGDGQHVWAAAEWVLMMRNMFVREEESKGLLILCSGIPPEWLKNNEKISFGPAPTSYGQISLSIAGGETIRISWEAAWHKNEPLVEIRLPGFTPIKIEPGRRSIEIKKETMQ